MKSLQPKLIGLSTNQGPQDFLAKYVHLKKQGHHVLLMPACDDLNQLQPYLKQCRPDQLYFNNEIMPFANSQLTFQHPSTLFYTSGSQGLPKVVVHKDDHLMSSAQESLIELHVTKPRTVLTPLPLWHVGGLLNYFRATFLKSQLKLTTPHHLADEIIHHPDALVVLVPTLLQRLLENHDVSSQSFTGNLFYLGGSSLSQKLRDLIQKHQIRAVASYGMTETAGAVAMGLDEAVAFQKASFKIINNRLAVQTPRLASSYVIEQKIRPLQLQEGYFITNDLGHVDQKTITVTGRADDIIISGGENIDPQFVLKTLAPLNLDNIKILAKEHQELGQAAYLFIEPFREEIVKEIVRLLPKIVTPHRILPWPHFTGLKPGLMDFERVIRHEET